MNPLRLAWLNLIRRRVTSAIAVVAIALSVAASGILLRLDLASENRFSTLGAGGDAIVGAKAGNLEILLGALNGEGHEPSRDPGFLPYKLFQSLEAQQTVQFEDGVASQPGFIEGIVPLLDFGTLTNAAEGRPATRVIGTNEKFVQRPRPEDALQFRDGHWAEKADQIVLGASVARERHLQLGDKVEVSVVAGSAPALSEAVPRQLSLTVAGILLPTKTVWDREAYTSVETAQRCLSLLDLRQSSIWGSQVLTYFLVYLRPGGKAGLEALVNRRTVAQVVMIDQAKAQLAELTGTGKRLGLFVTGLTLLLGALAVAAMLITRFEAMALQLAVLRAIGYTRGAIASWLLYEGLILGLAALVLGAAVDAVGFPLVRSILGAALPPSDLVDISLWQSAPVWFAALVATVVAVFVPLIRVYRQDVHFSLRDG